MNKVIDNKLCSISSDIGNLGYVHVTCKGCGTHWEQYSGQGTHEADLDEFQPDECPECENQPEHGALTPSSNTNPPRGWD